MTDQKTESTTPNPVNVATLSAYRAGYECALDDAVRAVSAHDRTGREWARGSLWGTITREAVERIEKLREKLS